MSPLVALMQNQREKLVGKGGVAVMYIQDIHEDELLVKMKIDELLEGKTHVISDSTYKDTNSDQTVRILQTKSIHKV